MYLGIIYVRDWVCVFFLCGGGGAGNILHYVNDLYNYERSIYMGQVKQGNQAYNIQWAMAKYSLLFHVQIMLGQTSAKQVDNLNPYVSQVWKCYS